MHLKKYITIIFIIASMAGYLSCSKLLPALPADDEVLDGPVEGLTTEQKILFLRGDVAFNDEIFTKESGLGPIFVATSCGSWVITRDWLASRASATTFFVGRSGSRRHWEPAWDGGSGALHLTRFARPDDCLA